MAAGQTAGARSLVSGEAIVVRNCCHLEEMRACVALQKEVWNYSDAELVPLRMFVVAEKIGGQVIAAFDGESEKMAGFALAIPGARAGRSYLHSQMLAVRKQYQNIGLGRRIKLFQREDGLTRGFDLIEWTFDPLEIKNAYLNIEKLGAIARHYSVNQYGSSSSPLQGGLPTDRLVAEWWIRSKRVNDLLQTGSKPEFEILKTVSVPAQIYDWKASPATRDRAKSAQETNRQELQQAFAAGLSVLGYERSEHGDGKFLLGRWEENCTLSAD